MTISIIVPVYNAEKTLNRCVDSVLGQAFKDWELILVNDGSTDQSDKICEKYEKQYSSIKYYSQENAGVSAARNLGLNKATGNLVTFLDSDDYLDDCYLANLYKEWNLLPNAKGIVSQSYFKGDADKWIKSQTTPFVARDRGEIKDAIELGLIRQSEPHSKLFNLDLIKEEKISFPIGIKNGEDGIFIAQYIKRIECALLSDKAGYRYVVAPNTASKKFYKPSEELISFEQWKKELEEVLSIYGCTDDTAMWEMISVPLYRYIRATLQCVDFEYIEKIQQLEKLEKQITSNYGKGREYSLSGKLFKFLVNQRYFRLLAFLYRFKI